MTKKHDYALYNVARVDGEWKKLDHFPVTISFDYYESDEEAMDDLRKKALYNLFREFSERSPFLPLDLDSRTYMICDRGEDPIGLHSGGQA